MSTTTVAARTQPRLEARELAWVLAPVLLGLVAVGLRAWNLERSVEVFVDEITYLRLSQGVGEGLRVSLYGEPFFLHPPGFFLLEGLVHRLSGVGSLDLIAEVHRIRWLNLALAEVTVVALWHLVKPFAGRRGAAVAALLFAVDPFAIRIASRNLLETSTLMWVVLGMVVLVRAARPPGAHERGPGRLLGAAGAGVLFGFAVLTKDVAALVTVLPMLVLFVTGWSLPRRTSLAVLAATVATYAPYPAIVVASGQGRAFFDDKTRGLQRFFGQVQETGYNAPGALSFPQKLIEQAVPLSASYLVLGAGGLSALWLVRRSEPLLRLIGVWTLCAAAVVGYTIAFGQLEEQAFYFLTVPSAVAVAIVATRIADRVRRRPVLRVAAALVVLGWAGLATVSYVRTRTTRDDSYSQLLAYLDANLAERTDINISPTSVTADFILDRYEARRLNSVADLERFGGRYVLLSSKAVREGHTFVEPAFADWVQRNGTPVFRSRGPSVGTLTLYEVPPKGHPAYQQP